MYLLNGDANYKEVRRVFSFNLIQSIFFVKQGFSKPNFQLVKILKPKNLVGNSYTVTHHSVPLQFVDQRCQAAAGWFAFSIHHLEQAAGHPALHHCSEAKSKLKHRADPEWLKKGKENPSERYNTAFRLIPMSCMCIITQNSTRNCNLSGTLTLKFSERQSERNYEWLRPTFPWCAVGVPRKENRGYFSLHLLQLHTLTHLQFLRPAGGSGGEGGACKFSQNKS